MHETPRFRYYKITAWDDAGTGRIKEGMTLAIEPMVNIGGWETKVDRNAGRCVPKIGSLSAHFEDTIAITDGEPEVLTSA